MKKLKQKFATILMLASIMTQSVLPVVAFADTMGETTSVSTVENNDENSERDDDSKKTEESEGTTVGTRVEQETMGAESVEGGSGNDPVNSLTSLLPEEIVNLAHSEEQFIGEQQNEPFVASEWNG